MNTPVRPVLDILPVPGHHLVGDGFRVQNYLPGPQRLQAQASPFLLLDYNEPYHFSPSQVPRGVGVHPHRGFETVTLVYEGKVAHRDSSGGGGVIGAGDVQWMTAASGILHEEFHAQDFSEQGGRLHSIQLWVNLPARYKMEPPRYQTLLSEQLGQVALDDQGSVVRVIAGEFAGVKGPASTYTRVHLFDLRLKAGAETRFELPAEDNLLLLVTQGQVQVNGEQVLSFKDMVRFANSPGEVRLEALEDSMLLVLGGEPIREPIASYGPFVMNSKAEIIQAIEDLESGKFGVLV